VNDVETTHLDREQQRRVEALRAARDIVRQTHGVTSTAEVVDVLAVAQFILNGEDPWPSDFRPPMTGNGNDDALAVE
jgi:hypothetical protein